MNKSLPISRPANSLWFLLFYDVVLAAGFGQTTHFYAHQPTWAVMGFVMLCNLFLYLMWMLTSLDLIANSKRNTLQKLFGLSQIVFISLAAIALGWHSEQSYLWGFLGLSLAVLSLIGLIVVSEQKDYSRSIVPGLSISSALFGLGAILTISDVLFSDAWAIVIFSAGIIVLTFSTLMSASRRFTFEKKISTHDLQERSGMLLLIILGEAFIVLVDSLGAEGSIPQPIFFLLTIVVVFAIWLLYFPEVAQFRRPHTLTETISRFSAHFLLIICSANAAAAYASQTLLTTETTGLFQSSDNWTALPLPFILLSIIWLEYLHSPRWTAVQTIHTISALIILAFVALSEWNNTEWGGFTLAVSALIFVIDAVITHVALRRSRPFSEAE